MSYCSAFDMTVRFQERELIQLTDISNTGAIDYAVIEAAISDAGAEIDGYLSAYPLPLSVIPASLTLKCCDIARYYLYDDHAPEHVEKRYERAIKYLEQVARGAIGLGIDDAGNQPETENSALMESGGRVFGRDDNGFL